MQDRMNKNKLQIGAYTLMQNAQSEQHIKELSECEIDFIVDFRPGFIYENKEALDLFKKYNVGLIAGMESLFPFWLGGRGEQAGQLKELHPIEEYKKVIEEYVDHPVIWGMDCGDEPSAKDFPYYNEIVDLVRKKLPNQFAYIDLYPNYASRAYMTNEQAISQLGTETYEDYIDEYCKNIDIDYIAYDHYVYSSKRFWQYYQNQHIVAEACRKTGRKYWVTLQVTNGREWQNPDDVMSLNQLRYQAFSSLAFGAEVIIWACYSQCWFTHNILDADGNKTEQYEKTQQVNREMRAFDKQFMKYRNVDTHFVGEFPKEDLEKMPKQSIESLYTGAFQDLKAENGQALIVGQMVERNGYKQALFVFSADDPMDENPQNYAVTWKSTQDIKFISSNPNARIETDGKGGYRLIVSSNEGVLLYY